MYIAPSSIQCKAYITSSEFFDFRFINCILSNHLMKSRHCFSFSHTYQNIHKDVLQIIYLRIHKICLRYSHFFFSLKTIIHNLYEKKTPWAKCLTRGAKEKKKKKFIIYNEWITSRILWSKLCQLCQIEELWWLKHCCQWH